MPITTTTPSTTPGSIPLKNLQHSGVVRQLGAAVEDEEIPFKLLSASSSATGPHNARIVIFGDGANLTGLVFQIRGYHGPGTGYVLEDTITGGAFGTAYDAGGGGFSVSSDFSTKYSYMTVVCTAVGAYSDNVGIALEIGE